MSHMQAVAAVMYLHAMVWLWRIGEMWHLHKVDQWEHPHGGICRELELLRADGSPDWPKMQEGWK